MLNAYVFSVNLAKWVSFYIKFEFWRVILLSLCDDLLLISLLYHREFNVLSFGLLVGQSKQTEDSTFGSVFHIFHYFLAFSSLQ